MAVRTGPLPCAVHCYIYHSTLGRVGNGLKQGDGSYGPSGPPSTSCVPPHLQRSAPTGIKWGPSFHSPWAMPPTSLANILTGSLINAMPCQACFLGSLSTRTQVDLKIALRGGSDMDARRRRGGGLEKWGSVSGPLFCVRTDVGAEGAGTQNLARKSFFHQ